MSNELDIRNAPAEVVQMLEAACEELSRKGYHVSRAELLAIRQRQATGEIRLGDPPVTTAEAPNRTVMVKGSDGRITKQTYERDHTPGLSPFDSAVRKLRSAAYAYNGNAEDGAEPDYTAAAILAREAFAEVAAALKDKSFMDASAEMVPNPEQLGRGDETES